MPSRLVYLPLEPYRERYTEYQSVKDGTIEAGLKKLGIDFVSIRPDDAVRCITTGRVLDAAQRCHWGFYQTERLVNLICHEAIDPDEDVIFIEDYWHPGFEMLPYTMSLVYGYGRKAWPKIFSYCYAQSVDPNDFTSNMGWWMRRMESSWSDCQQGIFVADPIMRMMIEGGEMADPDRVHSVGLFYDSDTVMRLSHMPGNNPMRGSRKTVVYSSRWDAEKDPGFFIELVRAVCKERSDITFAVSTGAAQLRSNSPTLVTAAFQLAQELPHHFTIYQGMSKQAYFSLLRNAKVQFNCAMQDFVSYTLLDATLFGCAPLYPRRLTFPGALEHSEANLYTPGSLADAKQKLYQLIDNDTADYSWVYRKYEQSLHRACAVMGFNVPPVDSLESLNNNRRK